EIAVKEAQRMGVTTVALIDTDSDPDMVDLPIPGNDDSIRSIELMLGKLADAVRDGRAALPPEQQNPPRGRVPAGAPAPARAAAALPPVPRCRALNKQRAAPLCPGSVARGGGRQATP